MSGKNAVFLIFFSLVAQLSSAQDIIKLKINPIDVSNVDFSNNERTIGWLNLQGIVVDENSSIQIHNEENEINLSCFNCAIRSIDSSIDMAHSYNEIGGGGTN
jgi:hypothetical protein